jgi:hypothetical protein
MKLREFFELIRETEDWRNAVMPRVLYHGTKDTLLPAIQREGLRPDRIQSGAHERGVFLAADWETASMYPDWGVGEDERHVVLAIDVSKLKSYEFGPDMDDWYGDVDMHDLDFDGQLKYALREIGQVVYNAPIPPSAITVYKTFPSWAESQKR